VEDTHTVSFDWGDGTTSQTGSHAYGGGGVYAFSVNVADDDTGAQTVSQTLFVTGAGIHDRVLQIVGTDSADALSLDRDGDNLLIGASFLQGESLSFNVADFDRIEVFLRAGDDSFTMAGDIGVAVVEAGDGADTIIGPDADTTWDITGPGAGSVSQVAFANVEALAGGGSADTFAFQDGADFSGFIDGGAGTNTLDYGLYTTAVVVDLATGAAQATTGATNIQNVLGGSGDDQLSGDAQDNLLAGNQGNDILSGGEGNDSYWFGDGWGEDTVIEGAGAGSDTLEFSQVTTALTVQVGTLTVTSDANTVSHAESNVENVIGGASTGDRLIADDATNAWHVTGTNAGDLNGALSFSSIENLTGGALDDAFFFVGGGNVTEVIDGGAEATADVLDFTESDFIEQAALDFQQVDLPVGDDVVPFAATGGITRIEDIRVIVLAEVLPDGTLLLNMGPRAAERLAVNTEDGNEIFTVAHVSGDPGTAEGETVAVTAFGITLEYAGVKRIHGNAGDGDDSVTIGAGVLAPVVLYGGLGNDTLRGGSGDDVLLGGTGQFLRASNTVLLIDAAYLVGALALNGEGAPVADQVAVDALLQSDVTLLAGAYNGDGSKRLNADGSWDSRALLLNLIADGDDTIHGGGGDDAIFGQGGDDSLFGEGGVDFVSGGAGHDVLDGGDAGDMLVGDEARVDVAGGDAPNVVQGLMLVPTEDSQEEALGIELGEPGSLIVPMLQIVPGREVNAVEAVLAHLFGVPGGIADNRLATSDGGAFVPYASVVTDFTHHLGQVRGNDALAGGEGDDTLVGDDLMVVERSYEFDVPGMAQAEAITRSLLDLSDDFSDLVHAQYPLLDGSAEALAVADHEIELGKDMLEGGEGNDVLVGDDSTLASSDFTVPVGLALDFRLLTEGASDAGDEIVHGLLDLLCLEHHRSGEVVPVLLGNDVILGGAGNDLVVGDALVSRSATLRLVAGGTAVQGGDAWHDEDWNDAGELDFEHHDHAIDGLRVGADQIDGGLGDDLVFGDSFASLTSTLQRAEGILDADYDLARVSAWHALDRLAQVRDTAAYWLAFQEAQQAELDNGDDVAGLDGADILFGQDGDDIVSGGDGDDWLIGGADKDALDSGAGDDDLYSGSNNSTALREAVAARQVDWESAFSGFGQPFSPFGVNGSKLQSTGYLPGFIILSEKHEETL
jgi:Ca2+-binding RTX toxin-like protein